MAYQVLARKYRPQRFSDVIGQEHVTRTLANALEQDRIAHGYIFSGHRGIGKTTIARILAMALNCRRPIGTAEHPNPERPNYEPCGTCESCEEVRAANSVDVIEIDAATNRGIDEIRELRDAARYRPARDRYKIYILDEAHQITDAAFNALLKTLEEPPDHVIFMMATTQPEDILQTIRSRCQHYSFHAVRFDAILAQLEAIAGEENVTAEPEALGLLAEAGDGSMRDALSIMDQAIASAPMIDGRPTLEAEPVRALMGTVPNVVFARLLEQVSENNAAAVLTELDHLLTAGNSPVQLARQLVRYLRNVLMARIGGEHTELLQLSPDERARAAASALLFGEEELTRFLQVMLRAANELTYRQEQRFHLELAVLRLVHLQRLLPVEDLLSQLGGSGSPRTPAIAPRPAAAPAPPRVQPAPPGAQNASSASRQGSAPKPHEAPGLSPFARDQEKKSAAIPRNTAAPAAALPPSPQSAAAVPQTSLAAVAAANPATAEPSPEPPPAPARPQDDTSAHEPEAMPVEPAAMPPAAAAEAESISAPTATPSSSLDLEATQRAACDALAAAGHTTAATLLGAAVWSEQPEAIRVEVAARKVMLALTLNAEADRLARAAMRPFLGSPPRPVQWVPAEGATVKKSADRVLPTSGVQADALKHPLVQQAKQLFGAEVRSVVDLRGKR